MQLLASGEWGCLFISGQKSVLGQPNYRKKIKIKTMTRYKILRPVHMYMNKWQKAYFSINVFLTSKLLLFYFHIFTIIIYYYLLKICLEILLYSFSYTIFKQTKKKLTPYSKMYIKIIIFCNIHETQNSLSKNLRKAND